MRNTDTVRSVVLLFLLLQHFVLLLLLGGGSSHLQSFRGSFHRLAQNLQLLRLFLESHSCGRRWHVFFLNRFQTALTSNLLPVGVNIDAIVVVVVGKITPIAAGAWESQLLLLLWLCLL